MGIGGLFYLGAEMMGNDLVLITVLCTFAYMGRRPTAHSSTMYQLVQSTIEGMVLGELRIINMPDDLPLFRKYLSEIGRRIKHKYTTLSKYDKLHVMRINYSNIYSKEIE
jgi:hypothetical protein